MRKVLAPVAAAALAAGCVSVQQIPMDASSAQTLRGKEVALAERKAPDFTAMTADKAAFGMIGAVAMTSAGNELVKRHGIEDPAVHIGETLAAELGSRYSIRRSPKGAPILTDEAADLAKAASSSDIALDVRTLGWAFAYFPTSWARYRVIYNARLRLVDTKSGKVLAEGLCSRVPVQTPESPSYEQLLADNAARLKQELRAAADYCVSEFKVKTLAL
jgi:hypothetical protein